MANITFKGNPIKTSGELPKVGSVAPAFKLTTSSLQDVGLGDYGQKIKILNIVPSLDTGICQASARAFNQKAGDLGNVVVLTISRDLPFAQKRFCEAEGLSHVIALAEMRDRQFGEAYGVVMQEGPMAGVLSRAVLVLDGQNKVAYSEQVPEIVQEPNYDQALAAVKKLLTA